MGILDVRGFLDFCVFGSFIRTGIRLLNGILLTLDFGVASDGAVRMTTPLNAFVISASPKASFSDGWAECKCRIPSQ
jgi:hypothetical protein